MPSRISVVVAYRNFIRDAENLISSAWNNKAGKAETHAPKNGTWFVCSYICIFLINPSDLFLSSHQTITSRDAWDFFQFGFFALGLGFFWQRRCNSYNVFSEFCDELIRGICAF